MKGVLFFLRLKDNVTLKSNSDYSARGAQRVRVEVEGVTYLYKVTHVDEFAVWDWTTSSGLYHLCHVVACLLYTYTHKHTHLCTQKSLIFGPCRPSGLWHVVRGSLHDSSIK